MKKGKIAILLSGRGSNFQAIYNSILEGKINAEISIVLSNKKEAPGLKIAKEKGLEAIFVDPKKFTSREEYDRYLVEEIEKRNVDLVCLAGWMRILTSYFVQKFKNKIMNIHPALLPAFSGLDAQRKALEYGVKFSGCTVHFVTEEVDAGPIILQAVVPVYQEDTPEILADRILKEEHRIYSEAIKLFFENRLKIKGGRVFIK